MSLDSHVRTRLRAELDRSVVVVAGAGTGKTTVLVQRIVELVRTHRARLREVAAITFTEAAAAELRQRVREALAAVSAADPTDEAVKGASEDVDEAAISTLHSFAQRLLAEQCAAAGLPAGFEVLDETAATRDFELRWSRFADELFEDPRAQPALVKGFVTGLRHTDLRAVARALHDNWDRIDANWDRIDAARAGRPLRWPVVDVSAVVHPLEQAITMSSLCRDCEDLLRVHLDEVASDAISELRSAQGEEQDLLHVLFNLPSLRCAYGKQTNWSGRVNEVRELCALAEQARSELLQQVRLTVLSTLVPRLAEFALRAARERQSEGMLTFHDLLVHARDLLRSGGEPLEDLRRHYRWILIDEFQDTDPIQAEIAARLVSDHARAGALENTRPGALFVVGDPKQSIYRFRRADIELFDRVGSAVGERLVLQSNFRSVPGIVEFVNVVFDRLFGSDPAPGQAPNEHLVAERQSPDDLPPPKHGTASARDEVRPARRREPSPDQLLLPLGDQTLRHRAPGVISDSATSRRGTPLERRPPVVVLGGQVDGAVADVRRRLAGDVARCITSIVGTPWAIAEATRADDRSLDSRRAARYSDIAVLIPTRTSLASLEEAFDVADIPYRLEGASMLWGSEDVREILAVLQAADDPADQVAVVAALRSPGLACGDDDLFTWHNAGGRWDPLSPGPEQSADHPVARAMALLRALHEQRWWVEPSSLVALACEELRSFELAFAHRRPRDHWQRIKWLCDQARLFDETEGGSLRSFLSWARLKSQGESGAAGVGPPDPDDDAVRVMTMHGAKGLEFPVVLLCGLERLENEGRQPPVALWSQDGGLEIRAGPFFQTEGYEEADRRDEELDLLERIRLLYVAMTRARDHLVVCLHRRVRNSVDTSLACRLAELCESAPALWTELSRTDPSASPTPAPRAKVEEPVPDALGADAADWNRVRNRWVSQRAELLQSTRRRRVVSATMLAHADAGDGGDDSAPIADHGTVAEKGVGYGLEMGRAVHSVLEAVDLSSGCDASGRNLEETCSLAARTHGIEAHAATVLAMVRAALGSEVVKRARTRRHWKETYVGMPLESLSPNELPGIFEGVVDLLFEEDEGLVVVDYKTDRISPETGGVATAATRHVLQVASYAAALERSTGRPVARAVILFLATAPPVEHVLAGDVLVSAGKDALRAARAELSVKDLVRSR